MPKYSSCLDITSSSCDVYQYHSLPAYLLPMKHGSCLSGPTGASRSSRKRHIVIMVYPMSDALPNNVACGRRDGARNPLEVVRSLCAFFVPALYLLLLLRG